ncbi:MAG: IMP dehydrogenase, partial [Opitutales bacterium]|nr:IMP dehydrogenase [Opitutales bacterium]
MATHIDDQFYKNSDDFFAANAGTGLTYDDVSLATCFSDVLPRMTRLDTTISDKISLSLPIMSADMDTVTESTMAIAMALHGGIGMIHYNMSNADQIEKVRRVKTYIHGMIDRPATVPADITVGDVLAMIEANDYNFSSFPVVDTDGTLLGLLRGGVVKSRHAAHKVGSVMIPREQVLTIQEKDLGGDPIATADRIFLEHIGTNKLLVVNEKGQLRGLFTLSDIERIRDEAGTDAIRPSRDENFRLRCGASVAVPRYPDGRVNYDALNEHVSNLVAVGIDAIIISTAHGHSAGVGECVRFVRDHFPELTIIAGNVTSGEGVEFLADAG